MFRWLAILFSCFILNGCTLAFVAYFRNLTDKPVEIWFSPGEYGLKHIKTVRYSHQILEMKWGTYKRLKDSLPVILYNETQASLIVPAGSTIEFPMGTTAGTPIFLKQEGKVDTIKSDHATEKDKQFQHKMVGFPVKSMSYFDYK
jgi:hypothetical protein